MPFNPSSILVNNGEVAEICALTEQGMVVRNNAGTEGLVAWRKIQSRPTAPVRLTYGYALTVDTAQGSTATEHPRPARRIACHSRFQGVYGRIPASADKLDRDRRSFRAPPDRQPSNARPPARHP
jgi:hypothetical protein